MKTEFDFGYEFADRLIEEFGRFMSFKRPYPQIDQDQIELMRDNGIAEKDIDEDLFWQGFNKRVERHDRSK